MLSQVYRPYPLSSKLVARTTLQSCHQGVGDFSIRVQEWNQGVVEKLHRLQSQLVVNNIAKMNSYQRTVLWGRSNVKLTELATKKATSLWSILMMLRRVQDGINGADSAYLWRMRY